MSEEIRAQVQRYIMRLIDWAQGELDEQFDESDVTMGDITDWLIAIVRTNEEEIEYKNLSLGQKTLADAVLAAYKTCHKWGRQSGRTHLAKYLIQELTKLKNDHAN